MASKFNKKVVKRIIPTVLVLAILMSLCLAIRFTSFALTSGDWSYEVNNGTAEITEYTGSGAEVTIPAEIGGYSVTSIGDTAFYGCTGLTSVTILNSVTSIGRSAFAGCSGLTSVTIGNSVENIGDRAFHSCTGLTNITIPNSVASIGNMAFSDCTGLTSVTIPSSVTSIGDDAFSGCTGLEDITAPKWLPGLDKTQEVRSFTVSDGVTSISDNAFRDCVGLTSVTIGSTVTTIGIYAFYDCTGLTNVTIGNSVTSIGRGAFEDCTGLKNITVDENNQNYSSLDGVLYNKNKTEIIQYPIGKTDTSFTIPSSVTSIGDDAFWNCTSLTSVTIGNSVESIGDRAFSYCTGLTSISIPNSVTSIGGVAFGYCEGLTSVTIGNSVTSIGDGAFLRCTGLTSVTIPSSVASIGTAAFLSCTKLTKVYIKNPGATVEANSFFGCSVLADVYIKGTENKIGNIFGSSATVHLLKEIKVAEKPKKSEYKIGESLDTEGLAITAYYDDNVAETDKIEPTAVSGFDSAIGGVKEVTVSYSGLTDTFEVEVVKIFTGITVTKPTKTQYIEGQNLDTTGMVVTAKYNDGTSKEVPDSDYTVSGFNPTKIGTQTITVSYNGESTTFDVTVEAKALTGITVTPPTKTTYIEGQSLDKTGMVVTANYNDGTSKEVTDYAVSGFDPEKIGKQTVTVTYGGETDTFEAEVKASELGSVPEQETKPDNEPEQENKPTPDPENNPEAENSQSSENSSKTEDKSEPDTNEKTLPDSAKTGDSPVYFAALCLTFAAAAIPVLVRGKRKKSAQ